MTELLAERIETYEVAQPKSGDATNVAVWKERFNNSDSGSFLLIDPCEIQMDLVVKDCPLKIDGPKLCEAGTVLKEGISFCPLNESRQLTLRSSDVTTQGK